MSAELVVERHEHVALVRLNRPERMNALSSALFDELAELCAQLEADDNVRAVVFIGAGRRAFSAGADLAAGKRSSQPAPDPIAERFPTTAPQSDRLDELGRVGRLAVAIYEMTKPTIAAVNGVAAGAGMSLALGCDLRIGSPQARFKTVFVERSLSTDAGMSFFLPRIVGYSRAADLILSSRSVDADESYRIGLLDRLVGTEELEAEALAIAGQFTRWPPLAVRAAKRTLQRNMQKDLREALVEERLGLFFCRLSPNDVAESRASWREKREPRFTGT